MEPPVKNLVPVRVTKYLQKQLITTAETLKLLASDKPTSEIARIRKTTHRNINKLFKKYQKEGLISPQRELTKAGKNLIKKLVPFLRVVPNSVPPQTIRLHDLQFNVGILQKPRNWDQHRVQITRLKKYNPTKWKGNTGALFQEFIIDNLTVRVTSKSILVKPYDIYAETPEAALNIATELLYDVIPKIENLFTIKLEKERKLNIKITRQHHALIYNHIARYCLDHGITLKVRDEKGEIRAITDNSKGLCELEFIHPQHSEEDARLILEKDIEDKLLHKFYPASTTSNFIGQTAANLNRIGNQVYVNAKTLSSLMKFLEKMIPEPEKEQIQEPAPEEDNPKGYR